MTFRVRAGTTLVLAALPMLLWSGPPAEARLPSCALGRLPAALEDVVPRAVAAEERRFAAGDARGADAFSTAAAAYVYGMPRVLLGLTVERFPTNRLVGRAALSDPESRAVVAPNSDTMYSVSRIDLRDGPLVIDAPATDGRYSVLQLLDVDTNAFAYVGSGADRRRASSTVLAPPGWDGPLPAGARLVRSPSTLVWLLGRTLVDGQQDMAGATAVMGRYALTPLDAWVAGARVPSLLVSGPGTEQPPVALPEGLAFLEALSASLAASPAPARDACALGAFARFGIGAGLQTDPALAGALDAGARAGSRIVDAAVAAERRDSRRRHNGWWLTAGDTARFGTDYARRALVARIGLAVNTPSEALYPAADTDSRGRQLDGRHAYVVRFRAGELPPVRAFWSLTLYDDELGLVANPIGRYALGDRTPGLRREPDGSLEILVQHDPPPARRRANWLPAPEGGFQLYLRLYEPDGAAARGRWTPPTIERRR